MFLAALILLVVAVLMTVVMVFGGSGSASVDFGLFEVDASATAIYFSGVASLALILVGLLCLRSASRRARARRADRHKVDRMSRELDQYKRGEHRQSGSADEDS